MKTALFRVKSCQKRAKSCMHKLSVDYDRHDNCLWYGSHLKTTLRHNMFYLKILFIELFKDSCTGNLIISGKPWDENLKDALTTPTKTKFRDVYFWKKYKFFLVLWKVSGILTIFFDKKSQNASNFFQKWSKSIWFT